MNNPPAVQRRIQRHIMNMGQEDDHVSWRAMRYLIRYYGVRALDELIEASYSENPVTRYRAAWALGHTRDPRAFEPLVRLVDDPDPAVRYDSTLALGILGDPRMIPVLTELARRKHADWPAFNAFSKWGLPAIPVMEELLRESDPALRHGALNVLGGFAQEYADAHCVELVRTCLQDPEPSIRSDAHYWLEELGLVPAEA